jgi:hypothetical protein
MSQNADLFVRHSRNCAQGIRSQGSYGQPGAIPGGFETIEGECAEDKAGIVAIGRMAHSPRQRSRTHGIANSLIFYLSGLFFVSLNEKGLERAPIWHCGGRDRSFDKSAEQHPS